MATGYSSSATTVTTLADFYEKTNTTVKTAIKLVTEEAKWHRSYPKEDIVVSGNENRVPLILDQPVNLAMIPDGGNEAVMSTPAPTHGTFLPVQMNARYGFTGLAQALDNRARAAMIENQINQQAMLTGYKFGRGIGLQTYGTSAGTVAVVAATGSAGATQTDIQLKNAYGLTAIPATSTAQKTYISNLFRKNDHVALIRSGAIVEFGTVAASPAASAGAGYVDITFTSSITPTVGDLIVLANADGDSTITGTDKDQWAYGFGDALFGTSLMGVTTASYPAWAAGSTSTTAQRFGYAVKEKMINDIWNAGGVQMDSIMIAQGVKRNTVDGQLGNRRYDGSTVDAEGDLKGFRYLTSQLVPPGFVIGWYSKAVSVVELSDQPSDGTGRGIFKLDKVQGKSQIAASYDYFYQRIFSSRAACGYAYNLSES